MVYKNGVKEYTIIGVACGLIYTILMGIQRGMLNGLCSGLFFSVIFTLFFVFFTKYTEKKSEHLRAEISKVRKIICEGPANQKKGLNAIGGWLFLSEDAIEFYPHKMNIGGQNIPILLDEITTVEAKLNQLKIHTKTDETYTFIVNKSTLWKQSITEIL